MRRSRSFAVDTIVDNTGGIFTVALVSPPSFTVDEGMVICPFTELGVGENNQDLGAIPKAAEQYFDSLGPGELVDLVNDPRGAWAYRWPEPNTETPAEAGQLIVSTLSDVLGQAFAGAQLIFISHSAPVIPTDLSLDGPSLITLNDLGVYSP